MCWGGICSKVKYKFDMIQSMFKLNLANMLRYVHISVKFSKTPLDIILTILKGFIVLIFGAAKESNLRRCSIYRAQLF